MAAAGSAARGRWLLSSALLLTVCLVTALSCLLASLLSKPDIRFLVLLDAGSVHTSVYTYRSVMALMRCILLGTNTLLCFRYYSTGPGSLDVAEVHACDVGLIGISSFAKNPAEAAEFVAKDACVLESVARIPAAARANSSVELCATAGMRVMRLADPDTAQLILGNLTEQLEQLQLGAAGARILSGREEAVRGWVTALQLTGGAVGALDWGGASAQLTVPVSSAEHARHEETDQEITVAGVTYSLHSQSNLCYGQAEALNRHRAALLLDHYRQHGSSFGNLTSVAVPDPCLPAGAVLAAAPLAQLFSSPCTQLRDSALMRSILAAGNLAVSFVPATASYDTCSSRIEDQFVPSVCGDTWEPQPGEDTCLDPSLVPRPPRGLQYLAMSTYWYLTQGMNLTGSFSLDQFTASSREVCALAASDPALGHLDDASAVTACFQSVLMLRLLTSGYHFTAASWPQLHFVKRVAGAEVGWGLGHAVLEANSLEMGGHQYIR